MKLVHRVGQCVVVGGERGDRGGVIELAGRVLSVARDQTSFKIRINQSWLIYNFVRNDPKKKEASFQ